MRSRTASSIVLLWLCSSCWRFYILVANAQQQQSERKLSVAVVGAGIGGSSTSFFLRELLGERVEIEVFDKAKKAGGRADVSTDGYPNDKYCDSTMVRENGHDLRLPHATPPSTTCIRSNLKSCPV